MAEIESYEKEIFKFDKENNNFIPVHYGPKKDGTYLTIRCGSGGIYTMLNEYKDGQWMVQCTDGSDTIAYSKETITLKHKWKI